MHFSLLFLITENSNEKKRNKKKRKEEGFAFDILAFMQTLPLDLN